MAAAMSDAAAAPVEAAAERSPLSHVSLATRGPFVLKAAALVALYYGSAKLGYEFNFAGPVAAIIWLPVGVAIAFLSVFGLAAWPGVLIGDLLANNYAALPVLGALGQTGGNMIEVLVAAALVRRAGRGVSPLSTSAG